LFVREGFQYDYLFDWSVQPGANKAAHPSQQQPDMGAGMIGPGEPLSQSNMLQQQQLPKRRVAMPEEAQQGQAMMDNQRQLRSQTRNQQQW
jgi:casein kinase I family protein HRR25